MPFATAGHKTRDDHPPTRYRGVMNVDRIPHPELPSEHVATIAYDGLLWDVYMDFVDDLKDPDTVRACFRFAPPPGDPRAIHPTTTVIIIEESLEAARARARRLDDLQLQSMLRSATS